MRNRIRLIQAAVACLCAVGCRHFPSAPTVAGQQFYEAGFRAEEQGNLALAQNHFQRAYELAQRKALGPASEAAALYEWSRVTGYLGRTGQAQAGFTNVLLLIDTAKGLGDKLRAPALCELARLLHDTRQHERAVPIFEYAVEELQRLNAPQKDPLSFADFLDDYADSLRVTGEQEVADAVVTRSTAIRIEHQTDVLRFRPRRYGEAIAR